MIKSMVTKDISDLWDAVKTMREDIKSLKKADETINADFLMRSYNSIVERLDVIQKDLDNLKQ